MNINTFLNWWLKLAITTFPEQWYLSHTWIPTSMTLLHLLQSLNIHQNFHFVTHIEGEVVWWWAGLASSPSLHLWADTCWIYSRHKVEASPKLKTECYIVTGPSVKSALHILKCNKLPPYLSLLHETVFIFLHLAT